MEEEGEEVSPSPLLLIGVWGGGKQQGEEDEC